MEDDISNQENFDETRRLTKAERKAKRREEKKQERERQKRRRKRRRVVMWVSLVAVIAIVVVGIIFMVRGDGDEGESLLGVEVVETDWIRGNNEALVTLVEYSDFECPACGRINSAVEEVVNELGDRIQFVYRHFPITEIHDYAQLAALAAEAAGRQDKFWEMHAVLFERQQEWAGSEDARDRFGSYAEELELDMVLFDADIEDDELRKKIEDHRLSGVRSSVAGTPTFFLNGERMKGYNTQDEFKDIIIKAAENS